MVFGTYISLRNTGYYASAVTNVVGKPPARGMSTLAILSLSLTITNNNLLILQQGSRVFTIWETRVS